jgi:hypothetical protein
LVSWVTAWVVTQSILAAPRSTSRLLQEVASAAAPEVTCSLPCSGRYPCEYGQSCRGQRSRYFDVAAAELVVIVGWMPAHRIVSVTPRGALREAISSPVRSW